MVLVNDGSTDPSIAAELESYAGMDPRVIIRNRAENRHISVTTNEAVELSSGQYIAFLDNDDMLTPDALAVVDRYIQDNCEPDLVYSDDARFNESGSVLESLRFKAGWSPELLLSYSYISHFRIIKREVYDRIGGTRVGMEGSQDHDMFLRMSEVSDHVVHIPRILYHRRAVAGSTAGGGDQKPYSLEAGKRAVKEAFARRGLDVDINRPDWAIKQNAGIFCPVMPDDGPSVTLVIPTKNNLLKLSRLLRSLPQTTYRNYRVLVIDNESDDERVIDLLNTLPYQVARIPSGADGFNYSALNNRAVEAVDTDYVLFLNDDTEVIDPSWLSQMVGWSRLPGVGAVGARLLFGSGRVQHGGISPSLAVGYTMFRGLPSADAGYLSYAKVTRNVAAVTAACMLTPTGLFKKLGGFDEGAFGVAYNDVDYCFRVRDAGLRIVFCGEATLYHHEGSSRPKQDKPKEIAAFREKYGDHRDPYFNPNWSRWHSSVQVQPSVPALPASDKPLRVLLASHNLNLEGAPQSLFELAAGLKKGGGQAASVISPHPGELDQRYAAEGIPLTVSPALAAACRAKTAAEYRAAVSDLAAEFRIGGYHVVIANTAEMYPAISAAAEAGIPSVWIIREGNSWNAYYERKPAEIETIALSAFALPYRVVFVSAASQARWSDVNSRDNFTLIRNGLDADRFRQKVLMNDRGALRRNLGVSDDDCLVVCVGTMCARKGQHDLLLAFISLPAEQQRRLRVLFVGERRGAYCEEFRAFVGTLPVSIQERIMIVAETSNVGMYYSVADVFFCGSRVESYPRVILEAEAVGLPIVTTPVSGIPEQVIEGANALFYTPANISELCDRLSKVLDPEVRREMSEASIDVFRTLTGYSGMISSYQEVVMQAASSSVIKR
ncbi:glycosyltransferase [Brevundimonas sp.]|uniref:glycosyltransferase n=1 Tax=Brevundimonas sp. TaxID=1871086 RepID=UPI0025C07943|nr:glycosyltransferase [Brevundimonas sp.]